MPFQFISGVEVKAESICICFIDDCMDCDVPLAELTFSREYFVLLSELHKMTVSFVFKKITVFVVLRFWFPLYTSHNKWSLP